MSVLLLAGCAGDVAIDATATPEVQVAASLPAFDPKLDPTPVTFTTSGDCPVALTVQNAAGQVATLRPDAGTATWAGRDDAGVLFDPGRATAVAVTTCDDGGVGVATADVFVVRLALGTVDLDDSGDGGHVEVAFHKLDVETRAVTPVDAATPEYRGAPADAVADADEDDGTPRASVDLWTNPDMPPWGDGAAVDVAYDVPAAYVAGSTPRFRVLPATTALSARTLGPVPALPYDAPPLRIVADGLTPVQDGAWTADTAVELDGAPLDPTLGRADLDVTWRWEAWDGDAWVAVPGSVTTTHRLYRLLGPPSLRDGTALGFAAPLPWIGTLEDLEPAVEGLPADVPTVLSALRDWLHWNDWLVYDPNDSAYSSYSGAYIYWDYTWSELGDWLDRDDGLHLYCHSLSCLFSVLAGTEGVYAPQQVLGVGFTTNLVRAAGTDEWLAWGFNSHSVVSPDDGATLWDASIDLDGDADPSTAPETVLEPKGLSFDAYTTALTADPIAIVNSGQCYVE